MKLRRVVQTNNHKFNNIKLTVQIELLTSDAIAKSYLSPISQVVTIAGI